MRLYNRHGFEIPEPSFIWADRLGIGFWLLIGFPGSLVYLFWGDPGAFKLFEQIIGVLTLGFWFSLRVIDWMATGRIR
ncbi:hypothetical protein [uncultured Devosia sp.]|uniref:hypothetical protein n=1 Tax=uncultured Devosia sp. TaxID=211434 RepID=UPI0026141FC3|nr:hypothetical protein [uncultured Devosia sp.]